MPENDPKKQPPDASAPSETVQFHYIKSGLFRVIHADGVIGGPAPREKLYINFFSERLPIPQQQTYSLKPDHTLGTEVESARVSREGVVREVEAAVVLDVAVAKSLLAWLKQNITAAEEAAAIGKELRTKSASKGPDTDVH